MPSALVRPLAAPSIVTRPRPQGLPWCNPHADHHGFGVVAVAVSLSSLSALVSSRMEGQGGRDGLRRIRSTAEAQTTTSVSGRRPASPGHVHAQRFIDVS